MADQDIPPEQEISRKIALDKSLSELLGSGKDKEEPEAEEEDHSPKHDMSTFKTNVEHRPSRFGMRDEDGEEDEEEVVLWLLTFTDVVALMLTFFVLLYSMSTPSAESWQEINSGLDRYYGRQKSPEWYKGPQDDVDITRIDYSNALDLNYLSSIISDVLEKHDRLKNIIIFPQGENLVISLPQDLLFSKGQADVSAKGKRALFLIGGSLANIRNRIEVIGHTDPSPVAGALNGRAISSNWELSLRRSMSVAAILGNVGYDRDIITRGLSSARYDELPAEWTEKQKFDISRRVDILVMQDDGTLRNLSKFKIPE